ncbi:MAG: FkbM family methyltransferase [Rhodospirillales bacterium]
MSVRDLARAAYLGGRGVQWRFWNAVYERRVKPKGDSAVPFAGFRVIQHPDNPYWVMGRMGELREFLLYAEAARRFCGPNPVILDIGANIGMTVLAFSRISGAQVEGFEPASGTFRYLQRNIEDNNAANARAHNMGVSDFSGDMMMGTGGSLDSREFSVSGGESGGGPMEKVHFEPLDAVAEKLGLARVDYIKIDAKDHEARVLAGAEHILRAHRPAVQVDIVKTPKRDMESFERLEKFIRSYAETNGYRVYQLYKKIIEVPDLDRFFAQPVIQNSIVLVPRRTDA